MSARVPVSLIAGAFQAFVMDPGFSCLGAKGAVRQQRHRLAVYGALGGARSVGPLARDLAAYASGIPEAIEHPTTFVAVFAGRAPASERAFERALWRQLQRLHEHDAHDTGWDPTASPDPDDPRFSFSFAGRAFFIVGLHPHSSRLARRFAWPALVFNPRAQFDRLRETGRYERLKARVREREIALQGSLNPSLGEFGERSEARQYSGRATEDDWRCPFHATRA